MVRISESAVSVALTAYVFGKRKPSSEFVPASFRKGKSPAYTLALDACVLKSSAEMRPFVAELTRSAMFAKVRPSGMVTEGPDRPGPAESVFARSSSDMPPVNVYVPGCSEPSRPRSDTFFVKSPADETRPASCSDWAMEDVDAPSATSTVTCWPSATRLPDVQPRTSVDTPRMRSSATTTMTAMKAIIGPFERFGCSALVS